MHNVHLIKPIGILFLAKILIIRTSTAAGCIMVPYLILPLLPHSREFLVTRSRLTVQLCSRVLGSVHPPSAARKLSIIDTISQIHFDVTNGYALFYTEDHHHDW